MAHYIICEKEDLEAVADVVRTKTGSSEKISLSQMQTQVGTIKGKLQSKIATPSANSQTIKPSSGYDGLSQVTVPGDVNLVAGNIKSGVSIFGVNGSYEGSGGSSSGSGTSIFDVFTCGEFVPSSNMTKFTLLTYAPDLTYYPSIFLITLVSGTTDSNTVCAASKINYSNGSLTCIKYPDSEATDYPTYNAGSSGPYVSFGTKYLKAGCTYQYIIAM